MPEFNQKPDKALRRYEISAWEGANTMVVDGLVKRGELAFAENARSTKIGQLEKRLGHTLFGNYLSATANWGLYDFVNGKHNLIRIATVSGTTHVYRFSPATSTWTQITTSSQTMSQVDADFTTLLDRCFIVNGTDNNRYIEPNGVTVIDSTDSTGMLYNSPKARLVNAYKSRVYLGDYFRIDNTRERTGICFSSPPLGIVSTVNGDHTQPITTLNVTDTKYIKVSSANDSLDVYRGGTLMGTITVTGKTENSLTISSFTTDLKSNDELWIANTRSAEKKLRWDNRATGISVKTYDSFSNTSSEDLTLLANVGNNMMIFTANNMAAYNGASLQPFDLQVGCVSKKSFVKILGQGVFLHYSGIYTTTGGMPKLVSAKIQQVFDNANPISLEHSVAATDGYSYFVNIGDVNFYYNNGELKKQLKDVVVEWNLRQNNFYFLTDIPMAYFMNFTKDSRSILLFAKRSKTPLFALEQLFIGENVTVTVS